MKKHEAYRILLDMAVRKANIYRGIKDKKQRRALKQEISAILHGVNGLTLGDPDKYPGIHELRTLQKEFL
jgi:hypothetical protein